MAIEPRVCMRKGIPYQMGQDADQYRHDDHREPGRSSEVELAEIVDQPTADSQGKEFYDRSFHDLVEEPKHSQRNGQRKQERSPQPVTVSVVRRQAKKILEVRCKSSNEKRRPDEPHSSQREGSGSVR